MLIDYTQQDVGYDQRHGGPYDRGAADAYYRRPYNPHFYTGATMQSLRIPRDNMTDAEIEAYGAGYDDQVQSGEFKQWA